MKNTAHCTFFFLWGHRSIINGQTVYDNWNLICRNNRSYDLRIGDFRASGFYGLNGLTNDANASNPLAPTWYLILKLHKNDDINNKTNKITMAPTNGTTKGNDAPISWYSISDMIEIWKELVVFQDSTMALPHHRFRRLCCNDVPVPARPS